MDLRIRLIGALLVACGLALCFGAVELWTGTPVGAPSGASATGGLMRLLGAGVVAVFGVGNVFAGLAVVLLRTARD
jgi:hypothetical protein